MDHPTEVASFRGDDVDSLVRASLACRRCLSGSVDWSLELEQWDAAATCNCRSCGYRRTVFLTGPQALRLHLADGDRDRDRVTRPARRNENLHSRVERCDARGRELRTS